MKYNFLLLKNGTVLFDSLAEESFTRIDHSLGVDSDTIQITIMLFEMRNRIPRILHRRIDGLYE